MNGMSPIIDALLMRMSELDRYSDDDVSICDDKLLPMDVVVGENGQFGVVYQNLSIPESNAWIVKMAGDLSIISDVFGEKVRTISEIEAVEARNKLTKYFGGRHVIGDLQD